MRIFLIGFMGCGKSTLGKRLALKLGYQFVDTDKAIEANIGMTISSYFGQFGEDAFRQIESETLRNLPVNTDCVVATGGGAPCFLNNINWMNENGITIYLDLPPKALAKRLANGVEQRPVLRNLAGEALEIFIAEKLSTREPYYSMAHYNVKGIDQTAENIIELLKENDHLK